jgi:hypothetical protein
MDKQQRTHEQRAIEQLEALGWNAARMADRWLVSGEYERGGGELSLISISTRRSSGTGSTIPGGTCSSMTRATYPHRS